MRDQVEWPYQDSVVHPFPYRFPRHGFVLGLTGDKTQESIQHTEIDLGSSWMTQTQLPNVQLWN